MSKSGGGGASDTTYDLLEGSILRETENEIIDQIASATEEPQYDYDNGLRTLDQGDCELEKANLVRICQQGMYCKVRSLNYALFNMCEPEDTLEEMTLRALEQLVCISGVIGMCMLLYVFLLVIEYSISFLLGTNKKNEH